MESALRAFKTLSCYGESSVSILVVVESALRGLCRTEREGITWGFNPCCSGIGSAGQIHKLLSILTARFNPCCSGIGSAGYYACNYFTCAYNVSILVVVESALREGNTMETVTGRPSFNPCCSGIGSAGVKMVQLLNSKMVVSILVVVESALRGPWCHGYFGSWCRVSILVVVESALRANREGMAKICRICFNPCCSGIGSAGRNMSGNSTGKRVSILVVVESALREC